MRLLSSSTCFLTKCLRLLQPSLRQAFEPGGAQGGDEAVPTRKEVRLVAGVKTEVLVQAFTDRILVLVTQLGRVGCLIQATTAAPASYVPTSSLSSRSLYEDLDADDLSQDPNPADSALGGDIAVSAYTQPPQTPSGAVLPTPLPSTALLSLFGTPPAGQDTLFSLYVTQVAAIVHARVGLATTEQRPGGSETRPHHVNNPLRSDAEPDPRPVVVGLALKRLSTSAGIGEEDDEVDVLDPGERGRFLEIMDMVLACRVW
ncbi:hypothetical protein OC861_005134 [Tilletia horrida]|nr:hypothetical protein OC861_005134 [Tilletia horrida]